VTATSRIVASTAAMRAGDQGGGHSALLKSSIAIHGFAPSSSQPRSAGMNGAWTRE